MIAHVRIAPGPIADEMLVFVAASYARNAKKQNVIAPKTLTDGIPPILYLLIGEASYNALLRNGNNVADKPPIDKAIEYASEVFRREKVNVKNTPTTTPTYMRMDEKSKAIVGV